MYLNSWQFEVLGSRTVMRSIPWEMRSSTSCPASSISRVTFSTSRVSDIFSWSDRIISSRLFTYINTRTQKHPSNKMELNLLEMGFIIWIVEECICILGYIKLFGGGGGGNGFEHCIERGSTILLVFWCLCTSLGMTIPQSWKGLAASFSTNKAARSSSWTASWRKEEQIFIRRMELPSNKFFSFYCTSFLSTFQVIWLGGGGGSSPKNLQVTWQSHGTLEDHICMYTHAIHICIVKILYTYTHKIRSHTFATSVC